MQPARGRLGCPLPVAIWIWIAFIALVVVLLTIDLGVLHRRPHTIGLKEALIGASVAVFLGLSFGVAVFFIYQHDLWGIASQASTVGHPVLNGTQAATQYITAYIVEESLSVDNLFVIAIVFTTFRVPELYRHRVLFWGILTAIIMRGVFILGGVWLVNRLEWLFYVFGAYLVYTALKLLWGGDEQAEPDKSLAFRLLRKVLPITTDDHGPRFIIKKDGKRHATMLLVVLGVIEWTDLVFAVDSIPAVLAVTREPFIAFTSNIFAILGLRSLYFVLQDMMDRFRYLKYAILGILAFVGVKMLLHEVYHLKDWVSLLIILTGLTGAVLVSVVADRRKAPADAG